MLYWPQRDARNANKSKWRGGHANATLGYTDAAVMLTKSLARASCVCAAYGHNHLL